jgi:hypothetical protein
MRVTPQQQLGSLMDVRKHNNDYVLFATATFPVRLSVSTSDYQILPLNGKAGYRYHVSQSTVKCKAIP